MKDIVMVSYRINDEMDTEADLIVTGEACSFVELISIGDGVQAISEGMDQLMKNPKAKDVLVLHAGSLQRICDTLIEGVEA